MGMTGRAPTLRPALCPRRTPGVCPTLFTVLLQKNNQKNKIVPVDSGQIAITIPVRPFYVPMPGTGRKL